MSSYIRTTRECSVSQLHPILFKAIQEYFQTHPLGDLDSETLLCCETIFENQNPGKLSAFLEGYPDTTSHLAILLTDDWLIWARVGDQTGIVVTAAKLKAIQVKAFVSKHTKDMELEVFGFVGDSKDYVRGTLEMGPDPAAQKFCEKVVETVLKVNPPANRTFRRWMGG